MAKKRNWQRKKKFTKQSSGSAIAQAVPYEAKVDFEGIPADLDEEQLEELVASLPKSTRKTKPKATSYDELQSLTISDLHAIAVKEKHPEAEHLRKRRDFNWAIISARLNKHVPVKVEGLLEVMSDGHAWLRFTCNAYLGTEGDVYVPLSLINEFGLRTGLTLTGFIRAPREHERYFCMTSVGYADGQNPDDVASRTPFKELVPLYPDERLILEGTDENPLEMRIADLITPIGKGQRGLIVAPPRTGKTVLLHQIARSIVQRSPDVHLMIVLIDERPEEVTDFERSLPEGSCEVVSSTFDESTARHMKVAEMVIEKARSLVESGQDVAILLDSITRLARSSNNEAPSNGKLLSGGLDATALQFPKRFFGSARNIENGGSLTILGTALIETGSKMDEVIFEEFKGTGNMELVLDRRLSDRRIFPAIDINRSGTRKEELLFTPEEIQRVWMLHKVLNEQDPIDGMEMLIQKLKRTKVNAEFLMTIGS